MSNDLKQPSCVGGPMCGEPSGLPSSKWTLMIADQLRKQVHYYERSTPSDPRFYFKFSRPLYRLGDRQDGK